MNVNLMERVKGIEPSYEAWEAAVLPLNYTRAGLEFYRHGTANAPPVHSPAPGVDRFGCG